MSTINDSDLLLVERNGNLHQITYDQMSTLNDDDILLVERGGVQYKVEAQYVSTGPNGVILPSVEVLTPLNGAGLNDGQSYTPMSSAYVSTDTTPVIHRYFPELIVTVSGGSWVNEDYIFDGDMSTYAELTGADSVVSQIVFTPNPQWTNGETTVYAYAAGGGSIEVLDTSDTVLRTYSLPLSAGSAAIGIVRVNENKIRITTTDTNASLFLNYITRSPVDYVIDDRVAFEFTDDTDLDKMVAPIIQTDENGNVKIPTTSTVDSTTTVAGEGKSTILRWYGTGSTQTWSVGLSGPGPRMVWAKSDFSRGPAISDNVANYGKYLLTSHDSAAAIDGPLLEEDESIYNVNNSYNKWGDMNYIAEIGVAPKILDIVSYSGDGSNMQEVPHNLGVKPGMIIVKSTNYAAGWSVWHKALTPRYRLNLNNGNAEHESTNTFASEPTKDAFYVGANGQAGASGYNYVAYVFADDSPGKVMCGSYTGNGANQFVYPGFEPGFVLIKRKAGSSDWIAATPHTAMDDKYWYPNRYEYGLQGNSGAYIGLSNNYFVANGGHADWNTSGQEYVYLAVAKDLTGPNSTQLNLLNGQDLEYFSDGTEITSNLAASGSKFSFSSNTYSGNGQYYLRQPYLENNNSWYDIRSRTGNKWLTWIKKTSQSASHHLFDSERSTYMPLYSDYSQAEAYVTSNYIVPYDSGAGYRTGHGDNVNQSGHNYIHWNFLAAPQFFDVQKYIGMNGSNTIQHDLGVEPGCIIIKNTDTSNSWWVWHSEMTEGMYMYLGSQNAQQWQSTNWCVPTDTDFTLNAVGGGLNQVGNSFISYIFAKDTPYVKCGKYTGAGAGGTTVSVGFKPRWVLIKCITGNSTHWIILDKKLAGNGQYLRANSSSGVGSNGYTLNADGFTVQSHEVSSSLTNGGDTYIYVAIADETEGHPPNAPSSSTVQGTPDVNAATMVVNSESFDVGDSASAAPLNASITSIGGSEGNKLFVDASTGTWVPGLYAKGAETTIDAPGPDEITFTSQNQGTPAFSGVDATLASRTWTLESGTTATGPWTLVDTYVDYDVLNSQTGATPWTSNKPNLTPNTFYRVKVQYNSTNAESVESVYNTFKTGDA